MRILTALAVLSFSASLHAADKLTLGFMTTLSGPAAVVGNDIRDGMRLALDHVNAHHHFHVHPTVAGAVINAGRQHGLRALRVPVRSRLSATSRSASSRSVASFSFMKKFSRAQGIFSAA